MNSNLNGEQEKKLNLKNLNSKANLCFDEYLIGSQHEFCYTRIIFLGRPLGMKSELIRLGHLNNLQPRAQKKFCTNDICTIFECFGIDENITSLKRMLLQHQILIKIDWYIEEETHFYLTPSFLNSLNSKIKEFLFSMNEIEETPNYMKRPKAHYLNLRQNFLQKNITEIAYIKHPITAKILNTLIDYTKTAIKTLKKVALKISPIKLRFRSKIMDINPPVLFSSLPTVNLKVTSSISTPNEPHFIKEEEPIKICFKKIGFEQNQCYYGFIYPTEPPTSIFAYILSKYPEKSPEDIWLFDDNGRQLFNDIEMKVVESKEYFFAFQSEVEKSVAKRKIIGGLLKDFRFAQSVLCTISEEEIWFWIEDSEGWNNYSKILKIPSWKFKYWKHIFEK